MKNKPIWTLEGQVVNILGEQNLSPSDRVTVRKVCQETEKSFIAGHDKRDKRELPDYQEADAVLKILETKGYTLPERYLANKENELHNLVKGDWENAPQRDRDLAHRSFLNRRHGRVSLDREGD